MTPSKRKLPILFSVLLNEEGVVIQVKLVRRVIDIDEDGTVKRWDAKAERLDTDKDAALTDFLGPIATGALLAMNEALERQAAAEEAQAAQAADYQKMKDQWEMLEKRLKAAIELREGAQAELGVLRNTVLALTQERDSLQTQLAVINLGVKKP